MAEFFTFRRKLSEQLIENTERTSCLFSALAYDSKSHIFLSDDKTLGFCFSCHPLPGSDDKLFQQAKSLLNDSYPGGTHMQIALFRSPDINRQMNAMQEKRMDFEHAALRGIINEREQFFKTHSEKPLVVDYDGRYNFGTVFDLKLYVSVKMPIAGSMPTDDELQKAISWQTKINTTLVNMRLSPRKMNAKDWLRTMSTYLNWGEDASWRAEVTDYDPLQPLNSQVMDYTNDIEITNEYLKIGKKYVKCLSSKRKPQTMHWGEAQHYAGEFNGSMGGVRTNYAVICNIFFPEADTKKQEVERKRQFAVQQSGGAFAKMAPILKDKEKDFNETYDSLNTGHRAVQIAYHVVLFANSLNEVEEAAMTARNHWRTNRFDIMVDKFIQLPVFINCLPLNFDANAIMDLQRYKTMTAEQAVVLLPINGEWKGSKSAHMNLISRNGQLMQVSLDDGGTNMNAMITGASGQGKSVVVNEFLTSYMSCGCRAWVIDIGYSYQKICEVYGGTFISFHANSNICLNPFQKIVSLDGTEATRDPSVYVDPAKGDDGQEDEIIGILSAMAAPTEPLSDLQTSHLKAILREVWCQKFRTTTIDDIQAACLAHTDERVKDIGQQLGPFTSNGGYGKYFIGDNNVEFNTQLVVLELEELKGRAHLQQVVLLQLMLQIQDAVYLGDRSRSLLFIDEAWGLLTAGDMSKFIEAAYRKFRKYGCGVTIATQNLLDLDTSPAGQAIGSNTATQLFLGYKSEAIEALKRDGKLMMSDYDFAQLRSVSTQPRVYSEIMIKTDNSIGIGRLVLSEFQKLLYSTNAEDVRAIKHYENKGMNVSQAINKIIEDRYLAS